MMEKREDDDYQVDLRCEEAREVMGKIPPAIVRWGMTVMTVIVGALLAAACLIDWPMAAHCPCMVTFDGSDSCKVSLKLSPEIVKSISRTGEAAFSVEIPLLDEEINLKGKVDIRHLNSDKVGVSTANVDVKSPRNETIYQLGAMTFDTEAIFIISNKKLIFHLFPFLHSLL